ncbi:response regulator transcription factor [Saccharothrix violaceirubra]|uniref:DNA-binding NarL/FixJ family response regulator n=1 Tax=Saccharothrix violaceirubra TaxID=413306 RepID=A0A7W7WUT7_9PSEU|nr:response regulator transcription factor [Saccharothrix violaceirubra]MBB4964640.1 DNA-binding NarL/FixJ family response regulator [Saccharothrix violaceirubra]
MVDVLVVARDEVSRAGFTTVLGAAGIDVVGSTGSGFEAVLIAGETRPAVVLLDDPGDMPVELVVARSASGTTRVLVLSAAASDETAYRLLRAGASGLLPRSAPAAGVVGAVRVVAAGGLLLGETFARRLVEGYTPRPVPREDLADRLSRLTCREVEVLRLVGTGLTNAVIAGRLSISEATVKTHLNRAMAKLDSTSRAQAVVIAYESGLVVPGRPISTS